MKRFASFLTLCLIILLPTSCSPMQTPAPTPSALPSPIPQADPFRVIAYATEGVIPELIPYEKITHINYSFLIPNSDGTFASIINAWKLEAIVEEAHNQNVDVFIAVGGWGWDNEFEQVAASAEARTAFVKNLKAIVDKYQLDGVDIDWEYPDPGQSAQNYLTLMKELRAALPQKLISTAVLDHGDEYGLGIPNETFDVVDYVNVMTYDGPDHGSMEQFNEGLRYWTERGVPKKKINIGVPFYTRPDELTYAKLVSLDPAAAQTDTFEYNGKMQTYNGIPTIKKKTALAMQNAGGIMFWELNHDAQGDLSLIKAIFEVVHQTK